METLSPPSLESSVLVSDRRLKENQTFSSVLEEPVFRLAAGAFLRHHGQGGVPRNEVSTGPQVPHLNVGSVATVLLRGAGAPGREPAACTASLRYDPSQDTD